MVWVVSRPLVVSRRLLQLRMCVCVCHRSLQLLIIKKSPLARLRNASMKGRAVVAPETKRIGVQLRFLDARMTSGT